MQISEDVKKIVMPLTIVWLALSSTMIVYGGFLIYAGKSAMVDMNPTEQFDTMKSVLLPLSYFFFVLTILFHRKLNSLIRPANMDKAPYAKGLNQEDRKILSHFGSYFVVHLLLYVMNEAGAVVGFVLTIVSGNFSYFLYPALIVLFLNLVVMRPRYFHFLKGKNLE